MIPYINFKRAAIPKITVVGNIHPQALSIIKKLEMGQGMIEANFFLFHLLSAVRHSHGAQHAIQCHGTIILSGSHYTDRHALCHTVHNNSNAVTQGMISTMWYSPVVDSTPARAAVL